MNYETKQAGHFIISLLNIYSLVIRTCQTIETKSYSGRSGGFLPIRNYKWLPAVRVSNCKFSGFRWNITESSLLSTPLNRGSISFFCVTFSLCVQRNAKSSISLFVWTTFGFCFVFLGHINCLTCLWGSKPPWTWQNMP